MLPAANLNGQRSVKDLFEGPQEKQLKSSKTGQTDATEKPIAPPPEIAMVNNLPVDRDEFFRVLYASAGTRVLRQFIGLELARQMAEAQGIRPTQADFDNEYKRVVDQMGPEKDSLGKALTLEDRKRILRAVLERRGLSVEEFEIGIKNQTYLKAIVKNQIQISDAMVQDEFKRVYGPRRTVRVIALPDMKLAETIYNRLTKGEKFAKLAVENSIDFNSAPIGGQLGEITKNDPKVPLIVSNSAYELKVGKFSSPIKVNSQFWIIKVDQESTPKPISYDKVENQLRNDLYDRLEGEMIEKLETTLFKNAKIKVYDRPLSKQFNLWMDQLKTRKE
jgi:parvulin-like peptidyl-prolyl isomerase